MIGTEMDEPMSDALVCDTESLREPNQPDASHDARDQALTRAPHRYAAMAGILGRSCRACARGGSKT